MSDENTQLAKRDEGQLSATRYEPKSLGQLVKYAKLAVCSSLCPSHIKNVEDAVLIIQRGAELGINAVSALQNMYVVKGKASMSAQLAVGICKASRECEYFQMTDLSPQSCTWETKRAGNPKPTTYTFTKTDAQNAGLWGSGTWKKYPGNMLSARASMNLARIEYPDLLAGIYTPDELTDGSAKVYEPLPGERPADAPKRKAAAPDVVDAEWEDAPDPEPEPEPELTPDVHWTAADYADLEERSADHPEWSKASTRFHAVLNDGDCGELAGKFKAFVKSRHGVESCKQIPPATLRRWADLVGRKSHETTINEAGDPVPSERWEWMRAKLDKAAA